MDGRNKIKYSSAYTSHIPHNLQCIKWTLECNNTNLLSAHLCTLYSVMHSKEHMTLEKKSSPTSSPSRP